MNGPFVIEQTREADLVDVVVIGVHALFAEGVGCVEVSGR